MDRSWARGFFWTGYCLTLIRDMTPSRVLDHLAVDDRVRVTGAEHTIDPAFDAWDIHDGNGSYVALTEVDGWALMFEVNGLMGVTREVIFPLSRRTQLVSHFRNVNAHGAFYWIEDGDLRVHLDPMFPYTREGRDAEDLEPVLREIGFDLRPAAERLDDDDDDDNSLEAAFALAERLTGVPVTPWMLSSSEFLCGIAALLGRELSLRPR